MVPDGTNKAASLPRRAATRSWSRWTVGSSSKTSSPTSAACMAARMPGVGRVTVSLRKSMVVSGMSRPRGDAYATGHGFPSFLVRRRLHPVLQEPAVADLAQEDLPVLDVLQLDRGGRLAVLPFALLEEAAEILHGAWVARQLPRGFLNQFLEAATVVLDAPVDECRVGEVGQQVVDPFVVERLNHRGEGVLRRRLRGPFGQGQDVVALRRFRFLRQGRASPHHRDPQDSGQTHAKVLRGSTRPSRARAGAV